MQIKFIPSIKNYFSLFVITIVVSGCESLPDVADKHNVLTQVIASDPALSNNVSNDIQAIINNLNKKKTLSEPEAVFYALHNNATFMSLLAELKLAKADLYNAGLLPNPEFLFSFSASDKPYRYAIDFPIEALWLRPIKIRNMKKEADATAFRLTQSGLNLIKDVRIAYAQSVLAQEWLKVTESSYLLRQQIHTLSTKRLASGDINGKDVLLAENDASLAKRDWDLAQYDVDAKMASLLYMLGVSQTQHTVALSPNLIPACQEQDIDKLLLQSQERRPDILAAEFSVEAATEKVNLSEVGWFKFLASADATSGQVNGHTLSPSIRTTVPVLNQNQGVISRSQAELEKAVLSLEALKQQAALEVRTAHIQYQQSCHDWQVIQDKLIPSAQKLIQHAKDAYQEGDISYLQTLEVSRQFLDTQMREVNLKAELIGRWAELNRATSYNKDAE